MKPIVAIIPVLLATSASAAAVVSDSWSADDSGPHARSVTVATAEGGAGLVKIKLAGLPENAKVARAWLIARRGTLEDPAELAETIDIRSDASGGGRPLALVGPWCDRFDATEAVRTAAASGQLSLLVKSFPGWERSSTRLEAMYEGKPAQGPPAVTGLSAFHRAGQTFLTWKEAEPLCTDEKLTWGQYRKLLAEAKRPVTYRIYAHDRPISAETLAQAEFIAEVQPLSCWNVNGRNLEYLIGQAMIKEDEPGELAANYNHLMYTWGPFSQRMDRYPLERFVVDEKAGPLAPGTGLYVCTPGKAARRYYAVVSCREGVENTSDFTAGNALSKPVEETVGTGEPVLQGDGLWGPFFDYPGQRKVYVQWVGPPLSPWPSMYFNWSVLVPPGLEKGQKAATELYFHGGNFSYAKPRQKFLLESIQIAPHDFPDSGWYGFNSAYGTLRSYRDGTVSNHTQRRIMAFLDWATARFPIDPDRLILPGSDGAAMLALSYPQRFAYVLINGFEGDVLEPKAAPKYTRIWGPKRPDIRDDQGRAEWSWAMLDELVKARAADDLPLFVCRGYSWGPFVKGFAKGLGRFYDSMLSTCQPLVADWTWASGQLVRPDRYTGRWRGLDLTRTTPVPALSNCSTDKNTEGDGQHNLFITWGPISDEKDSVTIELNSGRDATFDLTPRRLQNFKVSPGQKLRWEAQSAPTRTDTQPKPISGELRVDDHGRIILAGLKISARAKLTVKVTRAE